jgi:uncharacterized protein
MPEYLAPGVYVEETSFRSKSIEGVSTTTTGFIGPCRYGPLDLENELITSLGEFERTYGDRQQLRFGAGLMHNYLWHAVRAFFTEGGQRIYISRVFRRVDDEENGYDADGLLGNGIYPDGYARAIYPSGAAAADAVSIRARYPGAAGNVRVRVTLRLGQNVLSPSGKAPNVTATVTGALLERDVVLVTQSAGSSLPSKAGVYLTSWNAAAKTWQFTAAGAPPPAPVTPNDLGEHELRVITITVTVVGEGALLVDGLALDAQHTRDGAADSMATRFGHDDKNPGLTRSLPIVIAAGQSITDGLTLLGAIAPPASALRAALQDLKSSDEARTFDVLLEGGNDGKRPGAAHYEGGVDEATMRKTGLAQLEDLEDISIVAAPGATFGIEGESYKDDASTIVNLLIAHARKMRYRIAVLDSGDGQSLGQVRAMRAKLDSSHAALYYPWVRVLDPVTRVPIFCPPSGFVAGIYARNDTERAVYKAPANEVVNLSIGFEILLNKAQQDVLNPEGINAFRFFEGRGYRLWGARTVSSDPEWKYVNIRRYFAYLERSIDKGTQWAVFEPNGEMLWANVRRTIEDFLLNEWQSGALLGDKPEKAYFVRCDRSTMTQNDLDNGRLICLIGVAPLKPAEFVIFRIGQWTSDRKA